MKKGVVGTILFEDHSARYLPHFLVSLKQAVESDRDRRWEVFLGDNSGQPDNANLPVLESFAWDAVDYQYNGANLGFGKAYNRLIAKALAVGADYFVALNPDVLLEPDCLTKLATALESDGQLGSVSPKIRRWDFENLAKTEYVDSCGIVLRPGLIFVDLGQGEEDRGQFDRAMILGPSGAAAAFRLSALETVAENGQYFDEGIFMYKEDAELDYRLFLAGYRSRLVPSALAYHDRSAKVGKRKDKPSAVRRWSWESQKLIWRKYWRRQSGVNKALIAAQFFARYAWMNLRERDALRNK